MGGARKMKDVRLGIRKRIGQCVVLHGEPVGRRKFPIIGKDIVVIVESNLIGMTDVKAM